MREYGLEDLQAIENDCKAAAEKLGLEVPEVVFQFSSAERIYDIAARGLPGRYSHWRFGRSYEESKLNHDQGKSRIYELVVNTKPYQAYLLEGNSWVAQLLVIAHVYGHCWFFEHNKTFDQADDKFLYRVRSAADRIEDYSKQFGREEVEDFIDAAQALSLHGSRIGYTRKADNNIPELKHDEYGDLFPEEVAQARVNLEAEKLARKEQFPEQPEEDLLGFLMEHSKLEDWQRDILSVARDEAVYFWPQRRTKIANEGFASWCHNEIVHGLNLDTQDFMEFDALNAGVLQPHPMSLNPYSLGFELWREIERIHSQPTEEDLERWPYALDIPARERLLEVAASYDDVALISEYLTPQVCERTKLFAWEKEGKVTTVTSRECEVIKQNILNSLNYVPKIVVVDADLFGLGVLLLEHIPDENTGPGLDQEYTIGTLPYVREAWPKGAVLKTTKQEGIKKTRVNTWFYILPDNYISLEAKSLDKVREFFMENHD